VKLAYPRLYLRTAAHIGLALAAFVLVGAISLGLIAAWELRGYIETRHSSLGEEAARVLDEGGRTALVIWLRDDADIPADVSIYILDDKGQDILERQLPDQYTEFVRESVIGEPIAPGSNFKPVRLAPELLGKNGEIYAFLVLPKGISLWGSPATALGLLIVALLVIASVAWVIARAITRPVSELQLAVRELASGNITARVPSNISERHDELGDLAADFNSMARQLSELINARENLLREMSHELRSPLARLQAAIALAAQRNSLEPSEYQRIEQEIDRMNRVIGEMLRYSSLDVSVPPKKKLLRIDKLLKELIKVEEIEATSKGSLLNLDTQNELTTVGDPELLLSGFENILRNAIRYAPEGTTIDIVAKLDEEPGNGNRKSMIVVDISDRGPGVEAQHLERIFEPYVRVASGAHDFDSTGLGLAIVKRVIERHAGTVVAQPREGGGLTVTVRIPAAKLS
jgi:two-component system OmpR family sensor kinase